MQKFEVNPAAFTYLDCVRLNFVVTLALMKYNPSYSALKGTHCIRIRDLTDAPGYRSIKEKEFREKRDKITVFFNSFVERMHKLENDMELVQNSTCKREWDVVEASQHSLFNSFAIGLTCQLFCKD